MELRTAVAIPAAARCEPACEPGPTRKRSLARWALARGLLGIVLLLGWGALAMATEEPGYSLIRSYPTFEVRQYAPYLVAETQVSGDFDEVGNAGFRVLADYIFGNNVAKTKLAMTAPVSQRPADGETLAMTAPVSQRPAAGGAATGTFVISFVMPAGYRLDTLPVPRDARVQLREVPARRLAVRRYSGRWTRARYEEHERILLSSARAAGLSPIGEPIYARYNPPFTPWPMRRNEVMVEVR